MWILVKNYGDGFSIYGVTDSVIAMRTWLAGESYNQAYYAKVNDIGMKTAVEGELQ
jgi:hypothetical protein